MPNHITNHVIITGEEKYLKLIAKLMDTKERCEVQNFGADGKIETLYKYVDNTFNFEALISMPESEKDNWYDWRVKHWGTKWNSYDIGERILENCELFYCFCTAWDAPHPIIEKLSRMFPAVEIQHKFIDEGWCFAGENIWKAGIQIADIDYDCHHNDPSFRAFHFQMYGTYPESYEDDYDDDEEDLDNVETKSTS